MKSLHCIFTARPKTFAAVTIAASLAIVVWQFGEWRTRTAIRDLPMVERSSLEPGMLEIIDESQTAVLAAPFSGRAWGKYGSVLLAQEFLSEAVYCFTRAEKLDPREFRWPYLRGLSLERLEPEIAMGCFRKACEVQPDFALARVQLGEMLLGRNRLEEAERFLREADLLNSRDPRTLLGLGRLALLRNQLDEALERTHAAVRLDPKRRRIRLLLCQILQRRGDQEAVEEQLRILETIPETGSDNEWPDPILDEVAQYKRGTMWTLQVATNQIFAGQVAEAIALLERAGGQNAADPRIIVVLGKAYLRAEQLDKAEKILRIALEKDPNLAPAHFELGNLAMVAERWVDAAEHYRETVRLQPDLAAAHYNLGLYYQRTGNVEESISSLKLACRYMPNNFPAHREVAEVLLDAGRGAEAREHLNAAAKLNPQDPKLRSLIDRAGPSTERVP